MCLCGVMVGALACDSSDVGSTAGVLLQVGQVVHTHVCLCQQTVEFGTSERRQRFLWLGKQL